MKELIKDARVRIDQGEDTSKLLQKEQNVDLAAGLVKLWLRELPTPLFTFDLYDRLLKSDR